MQLLGGQARENHVYDIIRSQGLATWRLTTAAMIPLGGTSNTTRPPLGALSSILGTRTLSMFITERHFKTSNRTVSTRQADMNYMITL